MVPENAGSQNATTRTRAFSAFTDARTVSLDVGESDVPADYLLTISLNYNENGDRSATLAGITIHFVTKPETSSPGQRTLTSTDSAISQSGSSSAGQSPDMNNPPSGPLTSLVNNQVPQDTRALQDEMQREMNRSGQQQEVLMGYIATDPVVADLNRTLSAAGFTLGQADVHPFSNISGTFSLAYVSGNRKAVVTGTVNATRVLFAKETSQDPVPLPDPLTGNTSYRDYSQMVTAAGFTLNRTIINATPDHEDIDITFSGPGNRIIHATATIRNGTVTAFAGDSPDNPLAFAGPALALVVVSLLCIGIWYFARFREKEPPIIELALQETPGETAWRLIGEAEADARQDRYPDAYRKTGRALRISISHAIGDSTELTSGDIGQLIPPSAKASVKIRWVLERSEAVGFAKDRPDPAEFQEMIRCTREVLNDSSCCSGLAGDSSGKTG